MTAIIHDPDLERELIARRQASGADRYDEVWQGSYVIAPLANDEHQRLVSDICTVLTVVIAWKGLGQVRPGVNVSDRRENWQQNYRCPDIVVFLNDTAAQNCQAFWYGGPDFAVEIVSPGDHTREKLPFYSKIGTRELLIIDRDPWALTLYTLENQHLVVAGRSTPDVDRPLVSAVTQLTWQLLPAGGRPTLAIRRIDGSENWEVRASVD